MKNVEVIHCLEHCRINDTNLTAKIQFRSKAELDWFKFLWKELEQETEDTPKEITYEFLAHLESDMGEYASYQEIKMIDEIDFLQEKKENNPKFEPYSTYRDYALQNFFKYWSKYTQDDWYNVFVNTMTNIELFDLVNVCERY